MSALELDAHPGVILRMVPHPPRIAERPLPAGKPRRVRKTLLVALALSVLLHLGWTFWPVDEQVDEDTTVLQATLTEMPPPPVPAAEPVPAAPAKTQPPQRSRKPTPRRAAPTPALTSDTPGPAIEATPDAAPSAVAKAPGSAITDAPVFAAPSAPVAANQTIAVALPPRVDLAYKVFLGTQGFQIGDATYRFEHEEDRYRISTVGQARGLAALIVRGTGKIESRGRITEHGLRPYEFAVERGSADRREVAFFDWDAGNVVLHDGGRAPLEAPAFDPLTILWQPYFSPPDKRDQTFSLATTRRVTRYTLTLQGEETIAWPRGEILTERWHRRSADGNTDAWFWLAPSMHYIPIKMRVTRTSRGTLEVLLDSIRVDDAEKFGLPADMAASAQPASESSAPTTQTGDDIVYGMPGTGLPPMRAEDLHGQ